jgi:hypothetical protein
MKKRADKTQENKNQSVSAVRSGMEGSSEPISKFVDNRPEALVQRKLQEMANKNKQPKPATQFQAKTTFYTAHQQNPVQKKKNNTGLPNNLKSGIENLSGYSMDDVKVHYNSDKPAQLQAHAYAQGTNIHLGPGQEKHLPHEAWHVVQQKQGRVKPTMQMKGGVYVNDDATLEKEADVMGAKSFQLASPLSNMDKQKKEANNQVADMHAALLQSPSLQAKVIQRVTHADLSANATQVATLDNIPSPHPVLTIDATHTGDMYHTKAAAAVVDGAANILIIRVGAAENTNRTESANMMAAYFAGIAGTTVYYMNGNPPNRRMNNLEMKAFVSGNPPAVARKVINEGGASTLIMEAMRRADTQDSGIGGTAYRDARLEDMADGVAPIGNTVHYNNALTNQGHFNHHDRYVIVNFRQSGHGAGTHPELDTGRRGFKQIMIGVKAKFGNAIVVPMGEYDPLNAVANNRANLINYWGWAHIGGRADQAGLIRYFKENFNVIGAVGMRSGVMDSLALSGIPIVSIDINPIANNATDVRDKHHAYEPAAEKKAKGWDRGMKLEQALGPAYGRAFIKENRVGESVGGNPWAGELSRVDDDIIRGAVSNSLGPAPTRDVSHPLSRVELENTIASLEAVPAAVGLNAGQNRVKNRLIDILGRDYSGVDPAVSAGFIDRLNAL